MAAVPTPASAAEPAGGAEAPPPPPPSLPVKLPRVAIQFCTQCRWMLRAAYYAQELLSTFGPSLGEVALQPATGGVFKVTIQTAGETAAETAGETATETATWQALPGPKLLWDRAVDKGFPETKELKRRVRDVIAPGRDLGHVDRGAAGKSASAATAAEPAAPRETKSTTEEDDTTAAAAAVPVCEDCQ